MAALPGTSTVPPGYVELRDRDTRFTQLFDEVIRC